MKPDDSDHDSDRFLFMELDSNNETPENYEGNHEE